MYCLALNGIGTQPSNLGRYRSVTLKRYAHTQHPYQGFFGLTTRGCQTGVPQKRLGGGSKSLNASPSGVAPRGSV